MSSPEITLESYKLNHLHTDAAAAAESDTNTYEGQFGIRYEISSKTSFNIDFDLTVTAQGKEAPFFQISIKGAFSASEDTSLSDLTEKHMAACMLYPYVRSLTAPILAALGKSGMDFPLSVPFSAIATLDPDPEVTSAPSDA